MKSSFIFYADLIWSVGSTLGLFNDFFSNLKSRNKHFALTLATESMNYLQVLSNFILRKYFRHFYCVFLISDGLDAINFQLDGVKLVAYETAKLKEIDLKLACQGFVVHSKQILKTLTYLEDQMIKDEAGSFYNRRYLLISPDGNGKDIFGKSFLENVRDVLMVTTNDSRGFLELWTHKFVSQNYGEPVLLDLWLPNNGSFSKNVDLYPDKTSNLEGKVLKLSSFSYTPYDFVGESFEESKGIEISLIAEFVRRRNLTVVLKNRITGKWGRVYKNGTAIGLIGDVKKFRCDLACASFLQSQTVIPRVDFTVPTMKIRITCLVPKPKLIVSWTTPFTQFSLELWGLLATFLTLSSLILMLMNHLDDKNSLSTRQKTTFTGALFSMYRAILSQGRVAEDRFQRFKRIFIFIFLLTLVITTSYDSTLASRMVVPRYENVIDNVKDLAMSGLEWGGRNKHEWTEAIVTDNRKEYRKIRESFIEKNESELLKLGHAGVFGFPIDRLPSGDFAIQNNMDEATLEKLRPMRQEIYSGLSVIFAKKNYFLLPSLNEYILHVSQSGLLYFWELEGVLHIGVRFQKLLKYPEEKHEKIALSWNHIKGVFGLWLVGIIASILTFLHEVLKAYEMKHK